MKCLICKTIAGEYCINVGKFSIYKCSECGLEFTNPIPKIGELKEFYSTYVDALQSSTVVEINAKERLKVLFENGITEKSAILDFGYGKGDFMKVAKCAGVELGDPIPDGPFDAITIWGVLEHLADPLESVKILSDKLSNVGVIALTTVNAESEIPYRYKPPEHLTYWTKKSLHKLFDAVGMTIKVIKDYWTYQVPHIYMNRVLARTPEEYRLLIDARLPKIMFVPTNEVIVVAQKK